MKSLKEYIMESIFYKVNTFIETLKYDFTDANGDYEKYFVDIFNNASERYHAKLDKQSNIIISDKSNESMIISLKVGDEKIIGTPDMKSLVDFAADNNTKKYYLCSRIDGVDSILVPAHDLYELVIGQKVMVLASENRSNISPEVKAMAIKVKLVAPHGTNYDTTELYDEDYVSPADIKNKYKFK